MRSSYVLVVGLLGTSLIAACSSVERSGNTQTNSGASAVASNSAVPVQPANSNTVVMANGAVVVPQTVDANAASVASSEPLQPPLLKGRMDEMRKADTNPNGGVDAAQLAMKNSRPAPDDSTFTTYLTDAGYEIRTFRNNSQILKVEKKIENNGSQAVKVYLRNGKVVQLPGSSIPILSTASAASIASAAGLGPAAPIKTAEPGSTGAKKAVN